MGVGYRRPCLELSVSCLCVQIFLKNKKMKRNNVKRHSDILKNVGMTDEKFIRVAIEEAGKASWPFGAVVVRDGEIIAQASSGDGRDITIDPTAHAEVNAIRRACEKVNSGDLSGATLYASCEPCVLCFGAAWYGGIREIVFGSSLEDIKHIDAA